MYLISRGYVCACVRVVCDKYRYETAETHTKF